MSESVDKLNEILRELGYDVRGDVVIVRPTGCETLEMRRSEHALAACISTDVGPEFHSGGIRLERFRKNPVVLWAHDYDGLPIARSLWERTRSGDSEDDAERLIVKPQLHLDTELSREVWSLIVDEAGIKWELGVLPAVWHYDGGARVTKWDLVEISAAPSEECIGRIRQRIKDRMISSPAMLRSVGEKTEQKSARPTYVELNTTAPEPAQPDEFDEAVGPYRYDWERSPYGRITWIIYGLGFKRKVKYGEDTGARVNELNDAWRHGHDYATADVPEPPRPDDKEPSDSKYLELLEEWHKSMDRLYLAVRYVLENK